MPGMNGDTQSSDQVAKLVDENARLKKAISEKDSEIKFKETEIQFLKEQLKLIKHNQYAKKSETANSLQVELVFEAQEGEPEDGQEPSDEDIETITYTRSKSKRGRNIDTSHLPRETITHDLADDEKQCGGCNDHLVCIGEDKSEKLEYIPATLKVIEHIRPKYACRQCETVKAAKKPDEVIPKSMAGTSLLTAVIIAKYQQHMPLYRQSKFFKQNKLDIPANTLGNWVLQVGEALDPIIQAQRQQIAKTYALQADETPVKNKAENKKSYMWCYYGLDPGNKYVLYEYNISRGAHVPEATLAEFNGVLQTDGYSAYSGLRAKSSIHGVGCWAHARRKFADVVKIAGAKKPGKAHEAVSRIQKLYRIETEARDRQLTHQQRYELRQKKAKPILDKLEKWLEKSIGQVPTKSAIGAAIAYALKQWPYLSAYVNHGEIEIDNNLIENQIRPFALGRRNWMFVGNERGANAAATIYSLIQTCIINDINPQEYFNAALPKLGAVRRGEIDATMLLPQFFKNSD